MKNALFLHGIRALSSASASYIRQISECPSVIRVLTTTAEVVTVQFSTGKVAIF